MADDYTIANMFGPPKLFGTQDVDAARRFAYEQMKLPGQGETGGPGIGSSNAWQTIGALLNRMNATALTHGTYGAQSRMAGANARAQEVETQPYYQGPNPYANKPSVSSGEAPKKTAEGKNVPANRRYLNPLASYPDKALAQKWGATGVETIGGGHLITKFDNPLKGAAYNVELMARNYVGLPIWRMLHKWTGGNIEPDAVRMILNKTGLDINAVLSLDILKSPVGTKLLKAMSANEGDDYIPDSVWDTAKKLALGGPEQAQPQVQQNVAQASPVAPAAGGAPANIPQGGQPTPSVSGSPDGDIPSTPAAPPINPSSPITTGSVGGANPVGGGAPSGDPSWEAEIGGLGGGQQDAWQGETGSLPPGQGATPSQQPQGPEVAQANPPAVTPTINAPANYGVTGEPTSRTPWQQGWTDVEKQVQSMVPPPIQFDPKIFREVLGAGGDQKTLDNLKEAIKKQNGPQTIPWTGGNWSVDPLGRRKPVFIPDLKEVPIKVPGYEGREFLQFGPDTKNPSYKRIIPQDQSGGAGGEGGGQQGSVDPNEFPYAAGPEGKSNWGIRKEAQLESAKKEATKDVDIVEEAKSAVPQARMQLQNLKNLQKLSEAAGYGWAPTIQKWLAEHGLNSAGAGEIQAYQSALNYLAPRLRPEGSGRLLGTELQAFYDALGGLFMTPEGRKITFDNFSKIYEYQIDMGKIANDKSLSPSQRIDKINNIPVPELHFPREKKPVTSQAKEGIWYNNGSERIQMKGGKWLREDGSEWKPKK